MRLVPSSSASSRLPPPPRGIAAVDVRRYRALFDLAPDPCVVTDPTGRIADANRAACSLLARPLPALVGRSLAGLVARADRPSFLARLAKLPFRRAPRAAEWRLHLQPSPGRCSKAMVTVSSLAEAAPGVGALLLWSVRDVGARGRKEASLRESRARYRSLYRRMRAHRQQGRVLAAELIRAREEEARRIAHQLHDEAGQIATAFCLRLQELEEQMPRKHRRCLQGLRALVLGVEERLRGLSHELRPTILDDLGLAPAVGFLAEAFSSRTGLAVEVRGDLGSPRFDPPVETALYRVLQEAFANVARHARARHIVVDFRRRDGALSCSISDDGTGFEAGRGTRGEGGLGLLGIRERLDALGGRLLVRSAPGQGTTLIVTVAPGSRPCPAGS